MSYPATTIANYFLSKAFHEVRAVTPMQLLKLVYIAHGWHLGYYDRPLINEKVQAWRYGPVVQELYDRLKHYGSGAVRSYVTPNVFSTQVDATVDGVTAQLLDSVWKHYAGYSGMQLSDMTHQPDTPWDIAWRKQGGKDQYYAPIANELIRDFYKQRIAGTQQHA